MAHSLAILARILDAPDICACPAQMQQKTNGSREDLREAAGVPERPLAAGCGSGAKLARPLGEGGKPASFGATSDQLFPIGLTEWRPCHWRHVNR